jgi:cytochrome-b5 reductase
MLRSISRAAAAACAVTALPAFLATSHSSGSAQDSAADSAPLARLLAAGGKRPFSGSLSAPAPALSPTEFRSFELQRVEQLTKDTRRYTFALPNSSAEGEGAELGLSAASCLVVKAEINGKTVMRPYTPTSPTRQRGSMELIVKTYPQGSISK